MFGRLDILINNAGIDGTNAPTYELSVAQWQRVMDVNVTGTFLCTKHAIPHLGRADGGSIVNVSSMYGIVGGAEVPPYHASKAAVRMMAKTDAVLYAGKNIRAISVHPGYIRTPMMEEGETPRRRAMACSPISLRRRRWAAWSSRAISHRASCT